MDSHQQIITWLRDAHAMELSMENVLQRHIEDAQDAPVMRERLEQHLEETRGHADRVRRCLDALGGQTSTVKSMAASWIGVMQGMSTGMFQDELVKNALADYAMEHFEIACYTALLTAAEDANLDEVVDAVGDILAEEEAMSEWLREQIPDVTRMYLERSGAQAS
jgi:ferritin-like metal-binding protein YciE